MESTLLKHKALASGQRLELYFQEGHLANTYRLCLVERRNTNKMIDYIDFTSADRALQVYTITRKWRK